MTILQATSIDHINMNVNDLQESVTFYGELFGFELREDQPEEDSQIIGNDTIKLCLYEHAPGVKHGGLNHFGFHIENFDDVVDELTTRGIKMTYGVIDWGESRSVYIKDPNGYTIELSEFIGGGI